MRRKKPKPVARPKLNKREREREERFSAQYVEGVANKAKARQAGKPSPSAEPRLVDDHVTDELIRRTPKSRRPTNGELKESDQFYRDLKNATDRATRAPKFPEQPIKPEEATAMAKKKAEDKPEVTAKKGDKVRVVHRNTDGGWRLWEMATNKMIVHKLFSSERAAIQFATEHGLEPIKTGGDRKFGRKVAPEKASPAAATAKKPSKKKPAKIAATTAAPEPTTAESNGSEPAPVAEPARVA